MYSSTIIRSHKRAMAVCKWHCGHVWRLNQKSVGWHERGLRAVRPAAAASVSGSSCTRARFRHRWSSVCAVTKTGPELLSAWISRQVRSCGKVLSPVNIQFLLSSQASAWHPQDKPPPALCSFLFLNLHFLPSLPLPLSARTPSSHFDAFKCHQQPHRLRITVWFTANLLPKIVAIYSYEPA